MIVSGLKGLAALSLLISGPAFAQTPAPQSAAERLSIAKAPVRAGATTRNANKASGGGGWIIGAIALVAGVTYALVEGNDDDKPESP